MDATKFELTRIKPLPGDVLVELLEPERAGNIFLPDRSRKKGVTGDDGRRPGFEAIVRKLGAGVKAEIVTGDRVFVSSYTGRTVNENRPFRLVPEQEILAKFV